MTERNWPSTEIFLKGIYVVKGSRSDISRNCLHRNSRITSILEREIFHLHVEHIRGAQNLRHVGHPCHVVPSHIISREERSGTGVLQSFQFSCCNRGVTESLLHPVLLLESSSLEALKAHFFTCSYASENRY